MSNENVTNPCPECGREMECRKIPEIGSPVVGFCPEHGMKGHVDCIPPPGE